MLTRFATWSHDHAGAPCPDAATLGAPASDPWGHPWRITCTDQPGDQIIGITSAGPDGTNGTVDDIDSWQLGPTVTQLAHGARWVTKAATPPTTPTTPATKPHSTVHRPAASTSDDIPDQR